MLASKQVFKIVLLESFSLDTAQFDCVFENKHHITFSGVCSRHFSNTIADFIGLTYISGFPLGLKSHVLISHDYLRKSKLLLLPRERAAMCYPSFSAFYEGRSICNENSPVYPSFIFTHFIITFIKRSVSWQKKCKITVVQLFILLTQVTFKIRYISTLRYETKQCFQKQITT